MLWTLQQRLAVSILVMLLIALGTWRYAHNPSYVPNPHVEDGKRAGEALSRIDPNTASWQHLAALPGVGENRAKTIIAYREDFLTAHPGERAFRSADDLAHVKGIGPATTQSLIPYLTFGEAAEP